MSKDWKTERAEAAIKEGTDKIMKAAQKISKKEEPIFKEKIKRAKKSLENVEHVNWDSLKDANLDTPLASWDEESGLNTLPEEDLPYINEEVDSFEICLGVGLNQFFPEYIKIYLSDEK